MQVQKEPVAVGGLHHSNTQGGTSREVAVVGAAFGSILGGEDGTALTEEDRTATVLVDTGAVLPVEGVVVAKHWTMQFVPQQASSCNTHRSRHQGV